jgi:hypothetical protein
MLILSALLARKGKKGERDPRTPTKSAAWPLGEAMKFGDWQRLNAEYAKLFAGEAPASAPFGALYKTGRSCGPDMRFWVFVRKHRGSGGVKTCVVVGVVEVEQGFEPSLLVGVGSLACGVFLSAPYSTNAKPAKMSAAPVVPQLS